MEKESPGCGKTQLQRGLEHLAKMVETQRKSQGHLNETYDFSRVHLVIPGRRCPMGPGKTAEVTSWVVQYLW